MKQIGGSHYERCSIQPWEAIKQNELDYFTGNVLRYIMRHRLKNGVEDLLKAQHYIEYMIEHYKELYVQDQPNQGFSTKELANDLSILWRGANGTSSLLEEPSWQMAPCPTSSAVCS